ncbi:hypothetical protein KIPB_015438, partial [Kipferlia bialata]|eukprot:g15438.t1
MVCEEGTALVTTGDVAVEGVPHAVESPLALRCGVTLPSRIVKTAMSECLGHADGTPSQQLVDLHRGQQASLGGIGYLISGHVMVGEGGRAEMGNVVLTTEECLER